MQQKLAANVRTDTAWLNSSSLLPAPKLSGQRVYKPTVRDGNRGTVKNRDASDVNARFRRLRVAVAPPSLPIRAPRIHPMKQGRTTLRTSHGTPGRDTRRPSRYPPPNARLACCAPSNSLHPRPRRLQRPLPRGWRMPPARPMRFPGRPVRGRFQRRLQVLHRLRSRRPLHHVPWCLRRRLERRLQVHRRLHCPGLVPGHRGHLHSFGRLLSRRGRVQDRRTMFRPRTGLRRSF